MIVDGLMILADAVISFSGVAVGFDDVVGVVVVDFGLIGVSGISLLAFCVKLVIVPPFGLRGSIDAVHIYISPHIVDPSKTRCS